MLMFRKQQAPAAFLQRVPVAFLTRRQWFFVVAASVKSLLLFGKATEESLPLRYRRKGSFQWEKLLPERLVPAFGGFAVECRVEGVEIAAVQVILRDAECVSEALIVHDFAFPQVPQGIQNVRIVAKADQIVIGHTRFLLCGKVLAQVCNDVSLDADIFHVEWDSSCRKRINADGMVGEIRCKGGSGDFLFGQVPGQLMDDCRNHFHMRQFFGAQRSIGNVPQRKFSSKSCVSWALGT